MEAAPAGILQVWTIHDHPSDYPDYWIVTCDLVGPEGMPLKMPQRWGFATLERARGWIEQENPGVYPIPRHPADDPKIVESWI